MNTLVCKSFFVDFDRLSKAFEKQSAKQRKRARKMFTQAYKTGAEESTQERAKSVWKVGAVVSVALLMGVAAWKAVGESMTTDSEEEADTESLTADSDLRLGDDYYSDVRLKHSLLGVASDKYDSLGMWSYEWQWKSAAHWDSPTQGVLAQDVAAKFPFAARKGSDGFWRVSYSMLDEMAMDLPN